MSEHFSWLVELHYRQPDGSTEGQYTSETRYENVSAADADEAGEQVIAIYQASEGRMGLLNIKVVSVRKHVIRQQRRPSRAIFPR